VIFQNILNFNHPSKISIYFFIIPAFLTVKKNPGEDASQIVKDVVQFFDTIVFSEDMDVNKIHTTKETYAALVYLFAKCIVPSQLFKDMIQHSQGTFDKTFTVQDEAMCLLILSNNLPRWVAEAKAKVEHNGNSLPKCLTNVTLPKAIASTIPKSRYTMGTEESSNLRSGWGPEGMAKYEDFDNKVEQFREENHFNAYKDYALKVITNRKNGGGSKRQRTSYDGDSLSRKDNTALCEELADKIMRKSIFSVAV
jgi:hypothetical protein